MKSQIIYRKEIDGKFLGYLNDYPDHWTQGDDLGDLKSHLRDLYHEFITHDLPEVKRTVEIEVA